MRSRARLGYPSKPGRLRHEEDGAREYRKVCGGSPPEDAIRTFLDEPGLRARPDSTCRFEYLDGYLACENSVAFDEAEAVGSTFSECLAACDSNPDCSAVVDWWSGGPSEFECVLHLSSCDAPSPGGDYGRRTFQKVCD